MMFTSRYTPSQVVGDDKSVGDDESLGDADGSVDDLGNSEGIELGEALIDGFRDGFSLG